MTMVLRPHAVAPFYAVWPYHEGLALPSGPILLGDPIEVRTPSREQLARHLPASLPTAVDTIRDPAPHRLCGVLLLAETGEVAACYGCRVEPLPDRPTPAA